MLGMKDRIATNELGYIFLSILKPCWRISRTDIKFKHQNLLVGPIIRGGTGLGSKIIFNRVAGSSGRKSLQ